VASASRLVAYGYGYSSKESDRAVECSPTGPRVAEENALQLPCHAGGLVPDHADRAIGFCQSTRGRAAEAKAGHAEAVPTHTYGTVLSVHAHHMIHGLMAVRCLRHVLRARQRFLSQSRRARRNGKADRQFGSSGLLPANCLANLLGPVWFQYVKV
jgi:hypothetical protein